MNPITIDLAAQTKEWRAQVEADRQPRGKAPTDEALEEIYERRERLEAYQAYRRDLRWRQDEGQYKDRD
jgi:hypothetical protein